MRPTLAGPVRLFVKEDHPTMLRPLAAVAALVLTLLSIVPTTRAATDQQKMQKASDKIAKLHCLCHDSLLGLGNLIPFVGTAPNGRPYFGVRCESPSFDDTGAIAGDDPCTNFEVLPK